MNNKNSIERMNNKIIWKMKNKMWIFDSLVNEEANKIWKMKNKIYIFNEENLHIMFSLIALDKFELIGIQQRKAKISNFRIKGKTPILDVRHLFFNQDNIPTRKEIQMELLHIIDKSIKGLQVPKRRICMSCGEVAREKCGACEVYYYCSVNCQKNDWPSHRNICIAMQAFKLNQCFRMKCSIPMNHRNILRCGKCLSASYCSYNCRKKDKVNHQESGSCKNILTEVEIFYNKNKDR